MLKERKAQGLSITTIIVAVIGLIVLVVLIAILTGRMGVFSKGVDTILAEHTGTITAETCAEVCRLIKMDDLVITDLTKEWCNDAIYDGKEFRYMPGGYSDVPEGKACCCRGNA